MFARKVNIYILRALAVGTINMVVLYFIANYMGAEPLGLIGFGTAYINVFFMFAELGFGSAHVKRISEGKDIGICIGTYFTLKTVLLAILVLVIIGTLIVRKYFLHSQFENPEQERVIYFLLIPTILTQLSTVPIKTFEAKREAAKASISAILAPILKSPISISVALLGFGVYGLIFARVFGALVLAIIPFILLSKYPIKKPNIQYFKHYFSFAYKLTILTIMVELSLQLDKLMIGEFVSTEAVGMYYSVVAIIAILRVFPNAVGTLLFPTVSEYHARGELNKIKSKIELTEKYISLILLPIVIFLVVFSEVIIDILLGDNFLPATIPFAILAMYVYINGMRKPKASLLSGSDKMGLLAILSSISVVINIILNLILIPNSLFGIKLAGMGMTGAATSTLVSGIIYSILCQIAVTRTMKIRANNRLLIHYFAGFMMAIFMYFINRLIPISSLSGPLSVILLLAIAATGFIIFVAFLILFKEFSRADLHLIYSSIHPAKTKDYIINEIRKDSSE